VGNDDYVLHVFAHVSHVATFLLIPHSPSHQLKNQPDKIPIEQQLFG